MTEKELREIKRRFRPDKTNIPRIVGCFVNASGQIIHRISQTLGMGEDTVSEKLLSVMKRTLSGALGTNLTDLAFSTEQVLKDPKHALLMKLRDSHLKDEEALKEFFTAVSETVSFEGNYVILLANDVYDVPTHRKDGEGADSSESFNYIVCAVCPVKNMPESLSFKEADSLFHAISPSAVLCPPELGFMFPCFDDRRTNIYNALYYVRSVSESYPEFTERVFSAGAPIPPKAQREYFSECLAEALGDELSYQVVRTVHEELDEMIRVHKDTKDPEPLTVTKHTVKTVLAGCGIDEEKLKKLDEGMDEAFGKNAELRPRNLVTPNKFELSTPEVTVKVDPEHRDLVSTQIIGGEKYLTIKLTSGMLVNGINVSLED